LAKFDVNKYAQLGAEARAAELQAELAEIYRVFPALRRGTGRPAGLARSASAAAPGRKPMSAAQKRAVSIRMKKYWAARRKAKSAQA
jgi:hypothetical protein